MAVSVALACSRHAAVAENLGEAAGKHLPFHHHENHDEHHQNPVPEPAVAVTSHHPESVSERLPFRHGVLEVAEDARIAGIDREEFIVVGKMHYQVGTFAHQVVDAFLTFFSA